MFKNASKKSHLEKLRAKRANFSIEFLRQKTILILARFARVHNENETILVDFKPLCTFVLVLSALFFSFCLFHSFFLLLLMFLKGKREKSLVVFKDITFVVKRM